MAFWTHLIRFRAIGGDQIQLGQLVDTSRDVGQDSRNGIPMFAYKIIGSIFSGYVTKEILQVQEVCVLQKTSNNKYGKIIKAYSRNTNQL